MKLQLMFVLLFSMGVYAKNAYSQDVKVSIVMQNSVMKDVLQEIENKTDFLFLYNQDEIDVLQPTSIVAQNEKISEILSNLFEKTDIYYRIVGNNIVLMRAKSNNPQQSTRKITGTVTDEQGEPIIGVNVVEKGTTNGIITDLDGRFTLFVAEKTVLHVSYIGYVAQEIPLRDQTNIHVILKEDSQLLEEVVVVGYGTQRKKDVAGAISSVSSKDLSIQSANNIQNLLQGRLSGVSVATSGVPGETPSIRVRGIGTLSNNSPLYVIDGFPTKSEIASQINPSSIESVQVLKDASSASIYGAQAANGVILITTKQGKVGKAELNVKVNTGVQVPVNLPDMLNSQQYGEVLWSAMKNAGLTPSHSQYGNGEYPVIPDYILPAGAFEGEVDLSKYNTGENQYMRASRTGTDWAKEVYRPVQTTNIDLSALGGSQDSKYFISANYFSQDAILKWAGYDKISLRGNSQFSISDHINLGANMSAAYSKYKGGTSDGQAVFQAPLLPVYDVIGNWAGTKANGLGDSVNPVASLYNQKNNYNEKTNVLGNMFMEINFLNSFQFKTTVGANLEDEAAKAFSPQTYWNKGDKNTLVNGLNVTRIKRRELLWNNTLTFAKKLNEHSINALLGTEALSYKYEYLSASRNTFAVEEEDYRYLDAGETNKDNSENGSEYALFSVFGRINYQYMDKYYLSGVLRRDGSSRFGKNNQYGYFPGVSAAWRMSEESFMSNLDFLNDLKLRISYGKTGNQDIENYAFASMYGTNISTSSYPISGDPNSVTQGISKESIGNSKIKWETTTQVNFGLDASFFNNNLSLAFDYYNKNTSGI